MDIEAVRRALANTMFSDLRWVAETGSTNADVLALARSGAPDGLVLVADHQSAGKGRLGRTWDAPPAASLLLSILVRPSNIGGATVGADELFLVSMVVGVAAAEAARAATGHDFLIKWPNDLVVETPDGTRKLAGILAESVVEGDKVQALVVGIGLNVNWPAEMPDEFPKELADTAIALNHLCGTDIRRDDLLIAFLVRVDSWYTALVDNAGRAALLSRYRELSATIGRRVRVELSGETIIGDAIDVNSEGLLLVVDECPDRPRAVSTGDVVHLRAARRI